jgi:SPP1 gp7 family putative phage head morphogenesis protein
MAVVIPYRTTDAKKPVIVKRPKREAPFQKSQRLQEQFARSLRGVAREVGKLIKGYNPQDVVSTQKLVRALRQYADILGPWALHLSNNILTSVDGQDKAAWRQHTKTMSLAVRNEILNAPTGEAFKKLMNEQVALIQSIPLEAAERVHNLVTENLAQSARADDIAKKISSTENVTKSRANLIARTEIARAASVLTQARAEHVGSTGYIWRTSKDLIVRESHRKMEGRFVKWTEPPILDGMTGHAGCLPNCRCYPEPEVPDAEW